VNTDGPFWSVYRALLSVYRAFLRVYSGLF